MTDSRPAEAPQREATMFPWLAAWLAVGLVTVLAFELWVPRQGKVVPRLLAHAVGLALHVALGLLFSALHDLARRFVAAPRVRGVVLIGVAAVAGALLAEEDLRGVAELIPGPVVLWSSVLGAAGGAAIVVAYEVGNRFSRILAVRVGAILAAVGVALVHHRILESGYEGVHFVLAANAAALLAGTLEATPAFARRASFSARPRLVTSVVAAAIGAIGFVASSANDVVLAARRLPGNAVPALAARARSTANSSSAKLSGDSPWLHARDGLPAVVPTRPRLLPKDGIVVLITIDATRAELMKPPAIDRFPNLKRLREASVAFDRAHSAAPHTTPSLSTLMMGKYYSQIMWTYGKAKQPKPYDDKSPTIAETVSKRGAKSAAYVSLGQISEEYGLGRGFSEPAKRLKNAGDILAAVDKRVKKGSKSGLFVYSHVLEPHHPYAGKGKTPFEKYLGELDKVDEAIGPLVQTALDSDQADKIVLIVSSDHGEAFGEHNSEQHGTTLYEELMHVPLFIKIPKVKPSVSDYPVSLVDLGPTVMDLLDTPTPATFMGESLLPLITGKSTGLTRPLLMESGRMMRAMLQDGRYKYIRDARHGTTELYDLEKDPTELENLVGVDAERAGQLDAFIATYFEQHTYRAPGYTIPYYP